MSTKRRGYYMNTYKKDWLDSVEKDNFNEELFLETAKNIVIWLDLDEYVKDIYFNDSNRGKIGGTYNLYEKKIVINRYNYTFTKDPTLYYNLVYFQTLFHELTHADQFKFLSYCKNEEPTNKDRVRKNALSISIVCKKNLNYRFKHDLFPVEHEANYHGLRLSISFLADLLPTHYIEELKESIDYDYKLTKLLLNGYNDYFFRGMTSPIEHILNKNIYDCPTIIENVLDDHFLNAYEKMILGLPINRNIYSSICNMANNKTPHDEVTKYLIKHHKI